MINYENLNMVWASIVVEELIRNGIDYFCISPGSRSSPIVTSIARNKKARSIICYDERGSAFHALGYARAKEKPAVVVTTSGTAVANCFPAAIEASMDNIPLIILTADRPHELQDTKANQTIDQSHIFGGYVRYFFNLPCPSEDIPIQMLLTTVDQAVYKSLCNPQGPVHINCMFREPLSPERRAFSLEYITPISNWSSSRRPYTEYHTPELYLPEQEMKKIAHMINNAENGLLIIGALKRSEKGDVLNVVKRLKWPVFSDIRSHIFPFLSPNVISHFSLLLSTYMPDMSLDLILHVGNPTVSKHIMQLIREKRATADYIVIKTHPHRQDPDHASTIQVQSDIKGFCKKILPMLNPRKCKSLDVLVNISEKIKGVLKELFQSDNKISEASLAYWLSNSLPEDSGLFLSNSMPIRDMDMYAQVKNNVIIGANRGVSGIDGILATATGFAVGIDKPLTLIIGDLAFIHDLNSLFILKSINLPVIIILINNNGSGIFSFLDISSYKDIFEKYFAVPHNVACFRDLCSFVGISYFMPKNQKEFLETYKNCIDRCEPAVIEILINRDENYHLHKLVESKLKDVLGKNLIDKSLKV